MSESGTVGSRARHLPARPGDSRCSRSGGAPPWRGRPRGEVRCGVRRLSRAGGVLGAAGAVARL